MIAFNKKLNYICIIIWYELNKLRLEYLDLGLADAIDYEKFAMISIAYNSTKIEGCSLSETDIKLL